MKRSIIILIVLILFVSLPVFASTPTNENASAPTSEDQGFLGLETLGEKELINITGNQIVINDPSLTLIESRNRPIDSKTLWAINLALETMGFSESTRQKIINYLNSHKTLTVSVYQDENGNLLVIISVT